MGETVLSIVGKSLSVMAYTAMFISSSEVFPTEVRNAGMGLVMVFGGIANMAASFIGQPLVSCTNCVQSAQCFHVLKTSQKLLVN